MKAKTLKFAKKITDFTEISIFHGRRPMSWPWNRELGWSLLITSYPWKGRGQGHITHFRILHPWNILALFPGLPGWAGTRKVKPIWILLKQETVSGSGISWTICKSASRSRQITMPVPHHSSFLQAGCPSCCPAQPTASKHWRHTP